MISQSLMPEKVKMNELEIDDYTKYRGKCKEMAEALVTADPSLTLVRGHYFDHDWGPQQHWWCMAPDSTIVDPTKDQFPSKGTGFYEPFDGWCTCEQCGTKIREEDAIMAGNHPCCSCDCACRLVGVCG